MSLHKHRLRRLFVFTLFMLVLGIAAVVALVRGASGNSSPQASSGFSRTPPGTPIEFADVPAQVLAARGVRVAHTAGESVLPLEEIRRRISDAFRNVAIREVHFAECDVANIEPQIHRLCWAVSLDPTTLKSSGPPGSVHLSAKYLIALFDGASGDFLLAEAGR